LEQPRSQKVMFRAKKESTLKTSTPPKPVVTSKPKKSTPVAKAVKDSTKPPGQTKRPWGVYGGSANASKSRRCGECEGCMRDDCGSCVPCQDKPRFGGPGTKKKACVLRYCRTRRAEEDNTQANYPLNSSDALKGPRPVTKPVTKVQVIKGSSAGKVEDEDEDDVHEHIDIKPMIIQQGGKSFIIQQNKEKMTPSAPIENTSNEDDIEDSILQD